MKRQERYNIDIIDTLCGVFSVSSLLELSEKAGKTKQIGGREGGLDWQAGAGSAAPALNY